MKLTKKEKTLARSITEKMSALRITKFPMGTLSFPLLWKIISKEEDAFAKKLLKINPKRYGFKGKFLGISPVPRHLVTIRNQEYFIGNVRWLIWPVLLPRSVYTAYKKLNAALRKETGLSLLIQSGYRSPAYQLVLFFKWLEIHSWNFKRTATRAALPGWSEHGYPKKQAIDFMTKSGLGSSDKGNFEKTKEYAWLLKNAKRFGFMLSYPRGNKDGVIFEPWHWSHRR